MRGDSSLASSACASIDAAPPIENNYWHHLSTTVQSLPVAIRYVLWRTVINTLTNMAIFAAFVAKWGQPAVLAAFRVFAKCEELGRTREFAINGLVETANGMVSREEVEALAEAYDNIGAESLAEASGET